ncbi:MAG: hypothetical protein GYB68_05155 [Chloroflexi bacterium]|nr:hypothetical protein [Chloroflexota bacterium]
MKTSRAVQTLADHYLRGLTVSSVFGKPVQKGQQTIIPISELRMVMGLRGDELGEAEGLGGAGVARPIGYLEITDDSVRFRPTTPAHVALVIISGMISGVVLTLLIYLLVRTLSQENILSSQHHP